MKRLERESLVVLLIAAGLLVLAGAFLWLHLAGPSDGARLQPGEKVWRPDGVIVTPLKEAEGGLRAGDVVVAVDGVSMEAWAQALFQPNAPRPEWHIGQTVRYAVMRDGQRLGVAIGLGRYPLGDILARDWGAILFAATFQLVAAFVFFKRPDEPAARVMFLGAASMLSATTWSFGLQIGDLVGAAGFWLYKATTLAAYLLVWITSLHVSLIFPTPRPFLKRFPWMILALYAAPYVVHAIYAAAVRVGAASTLAGLVRADEDVGWVQLLYLSLTAVGAVSGYRAARDPVSRLQVRWVLFAFFVVSTFAIVFGIVPEVVLGSPLVSWNVVALLGLLVPLALAVAILRYRLFDIDVLIKRTLVYAALTAIVVALYVLVVGSLGALFQTNGHLLISLFATALVAVLFQPLREYLQRGVNRLMYGERDDPYAVLSRLGQRLEETFAAEAVLPTIVETVAQALKLPYVAIGLKEGDEFKIVAAYGLPPASPSRPAAISRTGEAGWGHEALPLVYQSETIGQLMLAPRGPGDIFTPADRRLLDDLARQAGVAAHAVRLTADVQRSRERLVTAREEERRRLRRDLHDGLGPALASLALKLDAARNLLPRDTAATDSLLADLKSQTQAAIADIRRLVYDLRPPALDELGLVSALREHVARQANPNGLRLWVEAPEQLPPLPAAVEVAAYRIALEAVTNAVRHARAHTCVVRLAPVEALQLEVSDDGVGLPADLRAGVGLVSMRERAAELGGTCVIGPSAMGGTRVLALLPLQPIKD